MDGKLLGGKVAVITGASRGIGRAIAEKLAEMGAEVVLCARREAELEALAEELRQRGGAASACRLDVAEAASWERLVERMNAQHGGRLNILVNNAGVGVFGKPLLETAEEDWERMVNTNLRGVYLGIKTMAPLMIAGGGGDIVNISSIASKNAVKNGAAYAATKWGVNGLSASAAEELRDYKVRVAVVCPGSTATELIAEMNRGTSRNTAKMLQGEDVAHVVAMMVTQTSQSFISEVVIRPTLKP